MATSFVSRFWPTVYNNKNQCHNCKQHESFSCNTTHWSQSLRYAQVMNYKGYVVSRQDTNTNTNNTKCMLSVRHHYNTTPVTPCSSEHFLKCLLTAHLRLYTVDDINHRKTVCILNVLDDAVSIQLCAKNALDIHYKHTASQLHVAERVS